jgi:hypothetical protein
LSLWEPTGNVRIFCAGADGGRACRVSVREVGGKYLSNLSLAEKTYHTLVASSFGGVSRLFNVVLKRENRFLTGGL